MKIATLGSATQRETAGSSRMGLYAHQDFKSKVDTTLLVIDSGMPLEMIKEKIKRRDAIHSYFESRKERRR